MIMDTIADFENRKIIDNLNKKALSFELKFNEVREKYRKVYISNYSARKEVKNLKRHKQTVLKAILTLIEDGLLAMTDNEIQERYFVDIGNVKNTRSTIRRERKGS